MFQTITKIKLFINLLDEMFLINNLNSRTDLSNV
jgi:hypothetical protein